jgi:hypothetical protein
MKRAPVIPPTEEEAAKFKIEGVNRSGQIFTTRFYRDERLFARGISSMGYFQSAFGSEVRLYARGTDGAWEYRTAIGLSAALGIDVNAEMLQQLGTDLGLEVIPPSE